jgi:hypothetical protein
MLAKLFVSIVLGVAVVTGCGNDPSMGACDDHTCIEDDGPTGIIESEGGQIIFEHVTFDTELQKVFNLPTGVTTATRVMAYFMSAQTPDSNPLPMPNLCNNLETTKGWPLHVGSPRIELDVGALTIIGKNAAGNPVSFDVPRAPSALHVDQFGRPHDIFYQVVTPDAPTLLKPDSFYDVKFGGSATVPATTFQQAIYLAADYVSVQNPAMEDNGPLKTGVDFPVAWTAGNSTNKPPAAELIAGTVLGVTWLLDMTGSPTHMCIVPATVQAFTIPGATITEYQAVAAARGQPTNKAIMLRNAIAHQVVTLPLIPGPGTATNRRRIDLLGLESWAQLMDVQ